MSQIGPFSERDLADKLIKIPEDEILKYHEERMKKYRLYYILALFIALISTVFIIVGSSWRWIGTGIAVVDIIAVGYVSYKRSRWKRIIENMIYVKRKREKTLQTIDNKSQKLGSKYDKIRKYQKKPKKH